MPNLAVLLGEIFSVSPNIMTTIDVYEDII